MQLSYEFEALFLFLLLSSLFLFAIILEPVIEKLWVGKDLREKKVQQTPKLMQIVLEGCTCEKQLALSI